MLVIRLRRIGKKNKPTYRIVVAEHSFPVDGKFTADLGFYNPHSKAVAIKKDEAIDWMKKGAKPSNTVAKLLEKEKVKHGSVVVVKRSKKAKSTAEKQEVKAAPAEAPAAEEVEAVVEETPIEEATPEAAEVTEAPAEPAA